MVMGKLTPGCPWLITTMSIPGDALPSTADSNPDETGLAELLLFTRLVGFITPLTSQTTNPVFAHPNNGLS